MYDVLFHVRAQKAYDRLPPKVRRQITRAIESLRADPALARNVAPLPGAFEGLLRLRGGAGSVVVSVDRKERVVLVLALGPRGDIYKKGP